MRRPHASLISILTSLTLLIDQTAAYLQSRNPQDVAIEVTKHSACKHKSRDGDTIAVHYNGTLKDGIQFDSSYDRHEPITFALGMGKVIEGWDEGLLDMCVGEERKLTIPANKAYGNSAYGLIPGGSTLIFETLLVDIEAVHDPGQTPEDDATPIVDAAPEDGGASGTQTAPAEQPTPETTAAPETSSITESSGAKTEGKEAALSDILTKGPFSMPTRLPDLPITGLQKAATAPAAVASQQPLPGPPTKRPEDEPGAVNGECRLLGPFALIVQACLGFLALSSLVFKRWRERPRRPIKIWFFDVSKQVVGSAVLHILNLLMSMFSAADFELAHKAQELSESFQNSKNKDVNPCSWYLINIAIDTTIGIPILIVLLRLLHHGFLRTPLAHPPESIKSGHYGQPPRATWWIKQSFIYFIGLVLMKLCVFFIIQLLPWIALVGDWALRWTEGNEALQVAFVMFVFPLIMNALQYYIIDSFIKDTSSGHERVPSDDDSTGTQASYHSVDRRDSVDSDDSDAAKETTRLAGNESGASTVVADSRSPSRRERVKDA